ncbi:class I SAM-dependent methyltransferase [Rhodococcus sp. H29-C3]|uniref:class I SAM-dependent methyltransferase n=1 Tax=Rhodococcus sp. H29-C3 TaxID=3046307 RepID=UPI0024B8C223|nr:class I SAM-dependent methyltransferase [Rhodococcus sp. H29-C3]MDJ0363080.1 class I SAM-dependent methyltransferase [Rhodococcus sp. H29-C3]
MFAYTDPYIRSADHLDLLSAGQWQSMAPIVSEALTGIRDGVREIVELGAGTGLGIRVICDAVPNARIVAIEPSSPLRAVLLHRIASDTDMRSRVTVENQPFPAARLPESFDALVMINTLGHLDRSAREKLWQVIATGLRTGGCAVINLQQPTTSTAVPEFEMAREQVGNRTYHGSAWAERIDDTTMKWHMTYRTSEGSNEIDATDVEYLWNVIDSRTLEYELAQHNLCVSATGDERAGVFLIESSN